MGGFVLPEKEHLIRYAEDFKKDLPKSRHIPSKVQADTLFTFTDRIEWLSRSLKSKMLSPRYCEEDIRYLKISNLKRMAYPMKCFCDINIHKLTEHLDWYGYYGLAFSKEWGMKHGIQPVQYINPDSQLRKDLTTAFSAALKDVSGDTTKTQKKLQNFMLHEIMYYKPYSGRMKNRITQKTALKCFTDECEWRYIPDVSVAEYPPVIFDDNIFNAGTLSDISNALGNVSSAALKFEYTDLKYIIVKTDSDFLEVVKVITDTETDSNLVYETISKIIIWDRSKGDF